MKLRTEQLIAALVADRPNLEAPIARTMTFAAVAGASLAIVAFFLALGFRADFATAVGSARFQAKLLVTVSLLLPAAVLVWRFARPHRAGLGWMGFALIISPVILVLACLLEMQLIPSADWLAKLQGSNALKCLLWIPLLSIAPLCALLYGLSRGAPTRPMLAGWLAGLTASTLAASLYAVNCTDDSPLFVATWHTMAVLSVSAVGAALGSWLLRW
jgi:hypothetical protein